MDHEREVEAAAAWMKLADCGDYAEAWNRACQYFQSVVTKPELDRALKEHREPLGHNRERVLIESEPFSAPPPAPGGVYKRIRFQSEFDSGNNKVETVTVQQQPGGGWKVSGYFIK